MRDDRERLLDILEAIERINRYAVRGRAAFESDELIQAWMVQQLLIVGEAASRVSESTCALAPGVPWRQIVALRNRLVHVYFSTDLDLVWSVIERDVTPLRKEVERVLELLGPSNPPGEHP